MAKRTPKPEEPLSAEARAQTLVQTVADACNDYTFDVPAFATAVMHQHRTLQQSMFRMMVECILRWRDCAVAGEYDGRNEATTHACRRLATVLDDERMDYHGHANVPLV